MNGNTGYFALCASVNRALKEGVDITNPAYYSNITTTQLEHLFRSDDGSTKCPLIEERVSILHDVGKTLLAKYDGNFKNCVIAAKNESGKGKDSLFPTFLRQRIIGILFETIIRKRHFVVIFAYFQASQHRL